jgi:hypothetical protein
VAERWQEIARELGTWELRDVGGPYNPWREMKERDDEWGEWLDAETTCKRIADLEAKNTTLTKNRDRTLHDIKCALSYVRGNGESAQNVRGILKGLLKKADIDRAAGMRLLDDDEVEEMRRMHNEEGPPW